MALEVDHRWHFRQKNCFGSVQNYYNGNPGTGVLARLEHEGLIKKTISEEVKETVSEFVLKLGADKSLGAQEIKKLLHDCAEENSAKFGKVMGFCRACIVGKMEGPDVAEMMIFIGVEETAHRLKKFLG